MNIVSDIKALYVDVVTLVRAEGRLLRAEVGEKFAQAQSGLILILIGLVFLMISAIVLVQSLIDWLALFTGTAAATLIVGLVSAICGLTLFFVGRSRLSLDNLKPHRTLAAARLSAGIIRDEV